MAGEVLPPLTWNPLRWVAALWIGVAFPMELAQWWAGRGLRRVATLPARRRQEAAPDTAAKPQKTSAAFGAAADSEAPSKTMPASAAATQAEPQRQLPQLLVSGRRADFQVIGALARALRVRSGIQPTLWGDDIAVGADWQREIEHRLDQCTAVLAVIGPGWWEEVAQGGEGWSVRELRVAVEQGKLVVPVIFGRDAGFRSDSLPSWAARLSRLQAVVLPGLQPRQVDAAADEIARIVLREMPAGTAAAASA